MGFQIKEYWGGRRKQKQLMCVRYLNGTYEGIPAGFFESMTPMARWGCRFWTVNDGQDRTAEYISRCMRFNISDQSPFEWEFADPDEPANEEPIERKLQAQFDQKERTHLERIKHLEEQLLSSKEKVTVLHQDLSKIRLELKKMNITDTKFHKAPPPERRGAN
eukprot:CAMPEP_0197527348 /NCGR_PEP_ID=MMETSP1318-20131121/21203_1 /TAXON_ID=552666 /ORGANISM="Partenskyella glossopodia, Strain RCC365" /LENGTH=162 /DNA_ID=CAMNT_0043081937 /DNA_START=53 /DNA_END=538 /DNA_ORIENTATION=-